MGGGGQSSSSAPTIQFGDQFPSSVGGTPDYSAVGRGISSAFNQYGQVVSAQGNRNYMTNTPNMPQSTITAQQPQTNVIPGSGMLGASVPTSQGGSMEALMRLLQGMYS